MSYEYYVTAEHPSSALPRPTLRRATHVYIRRRIVVASLLFSLIAALGVGAGNVLANRGGAPASSAAVRQATTYLVQPGDTLWSIAKAHRGDADLVDYVDALVALNGGATVQIGQLISLP